MALPKKTPEQKHLEMVSNINAVAKAHSDNAKAVNSKIKRDDSDNYTAMMVRRSREMQWDTLNKVIPKLEKANDKSLKLHQKQLAGETIDAAEWDKVYKRKTDLGNEYSEANAKDRALQEVENTKDTSGKFRKEWAKGEAVGIMKPSPSVQKMINDKKKKGGKK